MLKSKIKITSTIRDIIQELRLKSGKTGVELSTYLGKSEGWCSLVENGRISTIKHKDAIKMFAVLLNASEDEAEKYIVNLITEEAADENSSNKKEKFLYENEYDTSEEDELFEKILENINEGFKFAYGKQKKRTFVYLDTLMHNMHFDLGLMLGITSLPFHELEDVDFKIKKKLFSEIEKIVDKFVKEYGKVEDEEDETDTNEEE